MKLDAFFVRMKQYLSEEDFILFQGAYQQPYHKGIRVNPLRINGNEFLMSYEIACLPTSFSPQAFYVNQEHSGFHPYHLAGLYYIQEPSASSAVEVLAAQPGDIVLDLCAAPGGKSTQIGAQLRGEGLLVSNEIISSRAQILLSNMERMGVANAIITNMHPQALVEALPATFDKVLVDAPCSGEGMFRKDPKAISEWSEAHVQSCAARQLPILESAYQALREGGTLVYSTCTFSIEENEAVLASFLSNHPDMTLVDAGVDFGRPGIPQQGIDASLVRRIYPMDGGEGHFVSKMTKAESIECSDASRKQTLDLLNPSMRKTKDKGMDIAIAFLAEQLESFDANRLYIHHDVVYYLPSLIPKFSSLKLVRAGVCIGEIKHGLLRPHHHFYMAFAANQYKKRISFSLSDPRIKQFLQGMEIMDEETDPTGYCSIQVDGFSLGFGKKSNHTIKNHYPKGLRMHE